MVMVLCQPSPRVRIASSQLFLLVSLVSYRRVPNREKRVKRTLVQLFLAVLFTLFPRSDGESRIPADAPAPHSLRETFNFQLLTVNSLHG